MTDRVYLVVVRDGRVLQERSGAEPATERWWLPGGGVLPGETLAAAAAREAREEIGCAVALGPLLALLEFPNEHLGAGQRVLHAFFAAALEAGAAPRVPDASAQGADEGSGVVVAHRWVAPDEWDRCPAWLRRYAASGAVPGHYEIRLPAEAPA